MRSINTGHFAGLHILYLTRKECVPKIQDRIQDRVSCIIGQSVHKEL